MDQSVPQSPRISSEVRNPKKCRRQQTTLNPISRTLGMASMMNRAAYGSGGVVAMRPRRDSRLRAKNLPVEGEETTSSWRDRETQSGLHLRSLYRLNWHSCRYVLSRNHAAPDRNML